MEQSIGNKKVRALVAALSLLLVASACTKKKELKSEVDPNAYVQKSDFVGKTFQLSRGVEEADSDNYMYITPGMSNDFGLVQARITESEIQFVSVFDPNGRAETMEIVASFPIKDQFDIKRDTNDFGDQTNKIVEDRKKSWSDRQLMRVDWANPSAANATFLASLRKAARANGSSLENVFGATVASEENVTLLETPKVEPGHISWLVETAVRPRGDQSYRTQYRWHLTEVKPNDFKPVEYSLNDFQRFGYFFTRQNFIDPQQGLKDSGVKQYANVHNVCEATAATANLSCSTNKITWVLSKGFPEIYKPEARQAISDWNKTFKEALNRSDDIVVLDESTEATLSDPRYNVLAYYPSRTNAGLLGVAQWVADPRSGELKGVRATVYEDGIQGELGYVDMLIDLIASKDPLADVLKTGSFGSTEKVLSPFTGAKIREHVKMMQNVLGMNKIRPSNSFSKNPMAVINASLPAFTGSAEKSTIRAAKLAARVPDIFAITQLANVEAAVNQQVIVSTTASGYKLPDLGGMESLLFAGQQIRGEKERVAAEAELGIHGTELVEEAAVRYLMKLLQTQSPDDLKANREQIKHEIAKQTYYTTVLHEMGHAFGLRHNFQGSADRAHYHPKYFQLKAQMEAEIKAQGSSSITPADLAPYAFSSIMDYGGDFYSQVGGLGPYDKAAIKYAYNREINRDGDPVTLANYQFCTDHQLGEDLRCRQFDKGGNVSEITSNMVSAFNRSWALSHFRRDRVNFGGSRGLAGRMLQRTMIPVRQVMDEFIYSFIKAEQVAPELKTGGLCDMKFVRASVDAKEVADVCSPLAMEAAGVDPTDLSTLVNALVNPDTGELLKQPSQYLQYGLADLLFAQMTAEQFFQDTIGATEPGTYLALPPQVQGQPFQLTKLDSSLATDEDKLKAFAESNGIQNPDQFVQQAKELVTDVTVGGYGRPFNTVITTTAGFPRVESIGSFIDKYVAILALSFRDIGVEKYSTLTTLQGNAYAFPQTKKFATALFTHLISSDPSITAIPVQLRMKQGGKNVVVPAIAPASLNADTQAISTFVAFGLLASDTETSLVDKLRVCNANETQCNTGAGEQVVSFTSAGGGDTYKAAQTAQKDSIAFNLVTLAKQSSDERQKWIGIAAKSGEEQAANLMKLDESGELRGRIDENLGKIPELADFRKNVTDISNGAGSAWAAMAAVTQHLDQAPLFQTINVAQGVIGTFTAVAQKVDEQVGLLGDQGICAPAPAPAPASGAVAFNGGGLGLALDDTPAPGAGNAGTGNCAASPEAKRRATLVQLQADFKTAIDLVQAVMQSDVNAKAAPVQINNLTNDISGKEAQIVVIRRLLREAGAL